MYFKVRESIQKKVQIQDEDLEETFDYSSLSHFKKGDYLLRQGQYCRLIGFLNTGLIVTTAISKGKEIAYNFIYEGCFFTYTEG